MKALQRALRDHPLLWRLRPDQLLVGMLLGLAGTAVALFEPLELLALGPQRTPSAWGMLVLLWSALLYFAFVVVPRRRLPLGHASWRELGVSLLWTHLGMSVLVLPLCLYDGLWSARVASLSSATEAQAASRSLRAVLTLPCTPQWRDQVHALIRPLSPNFTLHESVVCIGPDEPAVDSVQAEWARATTALERVLQEHAFGVGPAPHALNAAARSWLLRQSGCLVFALLGLLLDFFSSPRRRWVFAPIARLHQILVADWHRPDGVPWGRDWARLSSRWPVLWASQAPVWVFAAVMLAGGTSLFGREVRFSQREGFVLVMVTVLVVFGLWFGRGLARRHSLALAPLGQWAAYGIAIALTWWTAAAAMFALAWSTIGAGSGPVDDLQDRLLAAFNWRAMAVHGTTLAGWTAVFAWLAHCGLGPLRAGLSLSLVLLPWAGLVPTRGQDPDNMPGLYFALVFALALCHGLCLWWYLRAATASPARAWVGLAVVAGTAVVASLNVYRVSFQAAPLWVALTAAGVIWTAALLSMLPALQLLRGRHLLPR